MHTGIGVQSRLTCNVHAYPHAKVAWFKDQERVRPKKGSIEFKGEKNHHILEIMHTEKEDLGDYTCVAENEIGRAKKTISLTGNLPWSIEFRSTGHFSSPVTMYTRA